MLPVVEKICPETVIDELSGNGQLAKIPTSDMMKEEQAAGKAGYLSIYPGNTYHCV